MDTDETRPGRGSGFQNIAGRDHPMLPLEGLPEPQDAVNPFYVPDALRAIAQLAESGRAFTADELHRVPNLGRPAHPNVIGSVFAQAHRVRVIEPIGTTGSLRPGRNRSLIQIWRAAR